MYIRVVYFLQSSRKPWLKHFRRYVQTYVRGSLTDALVERYFSSVHANDFPILREKS